MPYLNVPPIQFGPITIQIFGMTSVLAIILGIKTMRYRAAELNLDISIIDRFVPWLFAGVIIGAHLVSVILYYPDKLLHNPVVLLKFWDGISSYGGIIGGLIAIFLFFRKLGIKIKHYKQVLLLGALVGLLFGRLGCAVVHDHPGKITTSPIAVQGWPTENTPERSFGFYTDGPRRHDLGLYEFLFLIPLTGLMFLLRRFCPFENFHIVLVLLLYTPVRFLLDFLREYEKHYYGLTPGQYFSILFFIIAIYLLFHGLWNLFARPKPQIPT
ncbi:MAG: prolipoprotein diacylglyceryl transferase [Sedimentisphaerales bacterium]|nr:prolipoprotein diacylglyceryl transferase [Sedimentisphaerales bacterium]